MQLSVIQPDPWSINSVTPSIKHTHGTTGHAFGSYLNVQDNTFVKFSGEIVFSINLCSLHHRRRTCSHPRRPQSRRWSASTFDRPALLGLPAPAVCHPDWQEHRHSNLRLHLSTDTTHLWYDVELCAVWGIRVCDRGGDREGGSRCPHSQTLRPR